MIQLHFPESPLWCVPARSIPPSGDILHLQHTANLGKLGFLIFTDHEGDIFERYWSSLENGRITRRVVLCSPCCHVRKQESLRYMTKIAPVYCVAWWLDVDRRGGSAMDTDTIQDPESTGVANGFPPWGSKSSSTRVLLQAVIPAPVLCVLQVFSYGSSSEQSLLARRSRSLVELG